MNRKKKAAIHINALRHIFPVDGGFIGSNGTDKQTAPFPDIGIAP